MALLADMFLRKSTFLIDTFNEIAKIQENAVLVMIGFGELENEMCNRIKEYEITDRVMNLGRRDDIKQFYNAFDAFLLPSLYEGMPVVGIEAQCAGLPIFFLKISQKKLQHLNLRITLD